MGRKPKRIATPRQAAGPAEPSKASSAAVSPFGRGDAALFSLTLFLSAALLFSVQPMFAKMALPLLGGAPAVWNACLVFYQAALLAGYLYAHLSLKWLGARRQSILHLALLALAWWTLPIGVAQGWLPPATTFPAPWLWMLLAASLGLPFLAVSASAPMLQAWFARIVSPSPTQQSAARDPYFLYAASNLGSLLALLAYPLVIEATATLRRQSDCWRIGYGLLVALVAACAARLWRAPAADATSNNSHPPEDRQAPDGKVLARPAFRRRLRWLALSLVPSSLLLGVTTYISSEVTPMPFLWVIPLALYLLTFVFVFAPRTILPLGWMVRLQPWLIVAAAATLCCHGAGLREIILLGSLHLATFFVTAMVCHGQLAADRPDPSELTEFYLWMSLGGVLGGLFSALVAPVIFSSVLEYPLMMAAACLLRPQSSRHTPSAVRSEQSSRHTPSAVGPEQSSRHTPSAVRPAAPAAGFFARWLQKLRASGGRHSESVGYLMRRQEALPAAALLLCLIVAWGLRAGSFLSGLRFTDSPGMRIAVVGLAAFATFLLGRRAAVFGTAVAVLAAISLWSVETGTRLLDAERSFFGILRVEYDPIWNMRQLLHGTTSHGQQSLFEGERHEPQGYYHRTGPLGGIFEVLKTAHSRPPVEVGVLGLGVGTIAAYAEPGDRFTFFEIDPAVDRIAHNTDFFTHLADCRVQPEVILGDARLSLEHNPERKFDLLVVDVYSSDSVPIHLTTREALKIYFDHLHPRGLLAMHISSRFLDLEPILGNLAEDAGRAARIWRDTNRPHIVGRYPSVWVVMAGSLGDLGSLAGDPRWKPLRRDAGPVWTDDFSNVAAALRWDTSGRMLIPWQWNRSDQAKGHTTLAEALLAEGRTDEAIYHLQRLVEIEPESPHVRFTLGVALASRGRTDEAIAQFEEAVRLDPDLAAVHSNLGIALQRKGRADEALEHFRRAVEIDPTYVEGLRNLGKALLDRKQFAEAQDCFRKAIAIEPQSAILRFDLGLVLVRQGKVDQALGEFGQALPLAEEEKDAELIEKIKAEIRRAKAGPWE